MAAGGPTVIPGDPNQTGMRRRNNYLFSLRRRRSDIDSYPDMELCRSWNGDSKQDAKQRKLQKSFHGI